MANKINSGFSDGNSVVELISTENFANYPQEVQNRILDSIENGRQRDGGFVGKFFGTKKEITSMNIAAVICILLILICGMDIGYCIFAKAELHMELISTIIPVVSLALGFIFGRGGKAE